MREPNKNKSKPTTKAGREAKKLSPKSARSPKQQKVIDERNKVYKEVKKDFEEHMQGVAEKNKRKTGRPKVEYNQELAEEICYIICSTTFSIDKILHSDNRFPGVETLYEWIDEVPKFAKMYEVAKQRQAHNHVDRLLEIAEDDSKDVLFTEKGETSNAGAIARAKLRIDTAKWIVGKVLPKVYGDRTFNESQITIVKHEDFLDELE